MSEGYEIFTPEELAAQGMTEELADVEKLIEAIYKLSGRLTENAELLSEELFDIMSEDIRELYEEERLRIRNRYDIDHKREAFEHRERSAALVPRAWRFLFLHGENVAAKLITEAVNIDTDAFFAASEDENDENRPEYMPKMYLSRAQKREAKRIEREEARRERKEEKAKKARLRKLERDRKRKTKKERAKAQRDAEREERQKRREEQQAKRRRRAAEKSSKRIERRKQRLKRRKERKEARRHRATEKANKRGERRRQRRSAKSPKSGT